MLSCLTCLSISQQCWKFMVIINLQIRVVSSVKSAKIRLLGNIVISQYGDSYPHGFLTVSDSDILQNTWHIFVYVACISRLTDRCLFFTFVCIITGWHWWSVPSPLPCLPSFCPSVLPSHFMRCPTSALGDGDTFALETLLCLSVVYDIAPYVRRALSALRTNVVYILKV